MVTRLAENLNNTANIPDIFEIVKEATWQSMKNGRAGLTCGLVDMGVEDGLMVGAMYPAGSNIIVVNKTPLIKLLKENRDLYKPYAFHVLLHEYLHSLGYLDENAVIKLSIHITEDTLGEDHVATQMARDLGRFLPELTYAHGEIPEGSSIPGLEMIHGFDRSSVNYIS